MDVSRGARRVNGRWAVSVSTMISMNTVNDGIRLQVPQSTKYEEEQGRLTPCKTTAHAASSISFDGAPSDLEQGKSVRGIFLSQQ